GSHPMDPDVREVVGADAPGGVGGVPRRGSRLADHGTGRRAGTGAVGPARRDGGRWGRLGRLIVVGVARRARSDGMPYGRLKAPRPRAKAGVSRGCGGERI